MSRLNPPRIVTADTVVQVGTSTIGIFIVRLTDSTSRTDVLFLIDNLSGADLAARINATPVTTFTWTSFNPLAGVLYATNDAAFGAASNSVLLVITDQSGGWLASVNIPQGMWTAFTDAISTAGGT